MTEENKNILHNLQDYKQVIHCILCDSVLELGINESVQFPYVCEDCKEAIAYLKELKLGRIKL